MKKILLALVLVGALFSPAFAEEAKELNVFCWSEYIPLEVVNGFTKETGIKVAISTYESNEAMYAKLKLLQGKGYDLVVPSGYFVEMLAQDKLLAPLDKAKITGLENIDPAALNLVFDKGNVLTIPYMWGTVGLLVNKTAADPATITSWKDLARPEFTGKVLLSDDMRDTLGVGLRVNGHSINSTKPEEIQQAYAWLKKLKPSVRVFDVTATKQAFISEEVMIGFCWNGDAFIAMQENPNLEFIVPAEGFMIWLDNFAIPVGAEHKDNAHKFISYLLRPEIAKLCVEEYNYSTPNLAAQKLLKPLYAKSKVILPDSTEMARGEITASLGKARELYEKYWEMLKSGE
ncbi:MAG: spermidine/putrescine ABC transporter substrate-binding protein [Bilophila sp.]